LKPVIAACVAGLLALGLLLGCAQSYLGEGLQRPLVIPQIPAAAIGPARATARVHSSIPAVATGLCVPEHFRSLIVNNRLPERGKKVIALTFDDGPDPQVTPQILATLDRYQARATFFVIGRWAIKYPGLVRDEINDGHALGSHSYSHPFRVNTFNAGLELEETASIIERIAGNRTQLFRPPWGNLTGNLAQSALEKNYAVIRWSLCGGDGAKARPDEIVANVCQSPANGDIVLLHDGHDHEATALALPEIMSRLTAAGFKFVTVPQLLAHAVGDQQPGIVELYAAK
jgi:peptidoglycan-N-acetylglucosamine deacetylase